MGKIEIDHTGAGSGITLSSDGTDLLLNGTAIGGSPELYAENPSSPTAPSATGTNAVAIGSGATSTDINTVAIGGGADATGSQAFSLGVNSIASGLRSISFGSSSFTNNTDAVAIGPSAQAQSVGGLALGHDATVITGAQAIAIGDAYASGTDSFAAAIANNTSSYGATGANSVAIGDLAKASSADAIAIGNAVTAQASGAVVIGQSSSATGIFSTVIGNGCSTLNNHTYSLVIGRNGRSRGPYSFTQGVFGFTGAVGEAQSAQYVLAASTTTDTPIDMGLGGATTPIILPNNSAYAFHGTIVARQQASAGTACAAWKIEGLIRREGSAGTTVLVNSATTVLDNTPGWGMALSADTTNGGLKIEVTGAAATNIRWVATVHTSEVTY